MNTFDLVYVRPSHSLKFGGRWGFVYDRILIDELPVKVKFENDSIPYGFTADELVTLQDYFAWFKIDGHVLHTKTGQLSQIKEHHYPYVLNYKGDMLYIGDCMVISKCRQCKNLVIGEIADLCEECEYRLDEVLLGAER